MKFRSPPSATPWTCMSTTLRESRRWRVPRARCTARARCPVPCASSPTSPTRRAFSAGYDVKADKWQDGDGGGGIRRLREYSAGRAHGGSAGGLLRSPGRLHQQRAQLEYLSAWRAGHRCRRIHRTQRSADRQQCRHREAALQSPSTPTADGRAQNRSQRQLDHHAAGPCAEPAGGRRLPLRSGEGRSQCRGLLQQASTRTNGINRR